MGTGFNIGIRLKQGTTQFGVNIEAGNFNKFEQTEILKLIDLKSEMPGAQLFEKTIAKCLAEYFNAYIKKYHMLIANITTSQDLTRLSHVDTNRVSENIARALLRQSAYLCACIIAGIYEYSNKPAQFVFIGEGTCYGTVGNTRKI